MSAETTPTIHQAMAAVMSDVRGVGKHGRNQQQNFSFRGIDDVLNAVGPALRTHGVFLAPCVGDYTTEIAEVGQKRTPMKSVTVIVSYTFYGPAGDSITTTVLGESMDSGDKAFSKAMSVALRTVLIQTFALPTDEKDPDTDSYERAPRDQAQQQRPPQRGGNGHAAGNHTNGGQQQPDPRREAWTEAWGEAQKLNMTKDEFTQDFAKTIGTPVQQGTVENFKSYAQQLRESRETAGV